MKARDVFWVKGYAATSLDDIAAATGMNRPSLYAAFGDKQGIYLEALHAQARGLVAAVTAAAEADAPLRAMAGQIFARSIDAYLANGAMGCFLVGTALTEVGANAAVREIVADAFQRCEAVLERRIADAPDAPRDVPAKALAQAMFATLLELSMLARAGRPRIELEERARLAIAMLRL